MLQKESGTGVLPPLLGVMEGFPIRVSSIITTSSSKTTDESLVFSWTHAIGNLKLTLLLFVVILLSP